MQTTGSSSRLNPSPGRGCGNRAIPFRRPCRGSPHFVVGTGGLHHRLISATPPAFVIDAVPKLRKLGTFVTVLAYTKRLASLRPQTKENAFPKGLWRLGRRDDCKPPVLCE